ncbi:MAG TPA: hypothetical protein VMU93_13190 [Caulobacteraceae bacterium]|nr:hypothetical protein [Caulobacteraceae bacterium]
MAEPREEKTEDPHPGMMGDGTEEQNLGQPGHPENRIAQDEVEEAFGEPDATSPNGEGGSGGD